MGSIDGYSIVSNLTKLFSICARIRKSLGDIVVKNIKSIPLLRSRLLKLKVSNRKLSKNRKSYHNITTAFSIYILIIRTKRVKYYRVSLIISF